MDTAQAADGGEYAQCPATGCHHQFPVGGRQLIKVAPPQVVNNEDTTLIGVIKW